MLWYENIKPTYIYYDLHVLLSENPDICKDECIIFLINGNSGFGSQLTILTQNGLFLNKINPKIHCLGHFSANSDEFKYHEDGYDNSFFLYFNYLKKVNEKIKCYFLKSYVLDKDKCPFIEPQSIHGLNVDDIEINKRHSTYFKDHFELKIGDHIINHVKDIKSETKTPLIGIHLRSMIQLMIHTYGRDFRFESKIIKIKNELDLKYKKYNIFIATDVSSYINVVKSIFNESNVFYNDFINRVKDDGIKPHAESIDKGRLDTIINLHEYTGFKLGSDILYDCLSLINCDFYYTSITNIAFITSYINKKNNGIHFN